MRRVLRFAASKKLDIALWVFGWVVGRFLAFKAFVVYLLLSMAISGIREAQRRWQRRRAEKTPESGGEG